MTALPCRYCKQITIAKYVYNRYTFPLSIQFRIISRNDLFWRAVPGRRDCLFDATPEPPDPVSTDSIMISHFELTGTNLLLNVSWDPPENTFGDINDYQISIAEEIQPQVQSLEGQSNDSVLTAQPFTKFIVSVVMILTQCMHLMRKC